MTTLHVRSGALDDRRRGELLFAGDLIVYEQVPALTALCRAVEGLIDEPIGEAGDADRERLLSAVEDLQARFRADTEVARLFRTTLEELGVDVERTYWDRLFLRVQLPVAPGDGTRAGTLGVHRDTWSSNVYEQVNWWAPIRPITAERTIAFYPAYWTRPLANTSPDWDLDVVIAERKAGRANTVAIVPEPAEPVDTASELRVVIDPGDMLCFAGAHVHASVPNTTPLPRFSVEARTVNADDFRARRGAPNVDGDAPHVPLRWFRRMPDSASLAELAAS